MFKKNNKVSFWNKRAADMTVLDGIKLAFVGTLIGLLPIGLVTIGEAIKERKDRKEREKREHLHLEAVVNGREDSDTTW